MHGHLTSITLNPNASVNPGKLVTLALDGTPSSTMLIDRLPAIEDRARLSILGRCYINEPRADYCTVQGNGRDPIFHAGKSARHCQLHVDGVVFRRAKGAVFLDLPCSVTMHHGGIESIDGPAVYAPRSLASFSLRDIFITNCSHAAHGGALVLGSCGGYLGNHYFEQCQFSGNHAGMGGRAVYAAGQGTLRMTDCSIISNSAMYRGVGVFLAGPSFLSVRNSIQWNTAVFGTGGGIFSFGQPVKPPRPPASVLINMCGNLLWSNCTPRVSGAASMGLAWNGPCSCAAWR